MKFKPGPPKPSEACALPHLIKRVKSGARITGAKQISPSCLKVFMDGPLNYHIETSAKLVEFLRSKGCNI